MNSSSIFEQLESRILLSGTPAPDALDSNAAVEVNVNSNQSTEQQQLISEIVFIDSAVQDYQSIINDLQKNVEIYIIDSETDGIKKISSILEDRQNIDAIHIISHGSNGQIQLGRTSLNNESLSSYQKELTSWKTSLSESADILIYGCNVGQDDKFLEDLSVYTGADIAASDDLTGNEENKGDWILENAIGLIDTNIIISQEMQNLYQYTLDETFDFNSLVISDSGVSTFTLTEGTDTLKVTAVDDLLFEYSYQIGGAINGTESLIAGDVAGVSGGSGVTSVKFEMNDGSSFDLGTLTISDEDGSSNSYTFTTSDSNTSNQSITPSSAGETIDLSSNTDFDGITYFTISKNGGGSLFIGIDDIVLTNVTPANNAPSLGGTSADATATEDVATAIDLSAYNISDADGDTITLTLGVNDGTIASTDGNGITADVTIAGSGSASMTLEGTAADLNAYLNETSKIEFTTASNITSAVTLTVTPNDGIENGTADTVTINITGINDEPTLTATGSNPTFTEGGAAASLFSGSAASTVESGQTLTGFSFTVTNLNDGSSEIANVDGTAIALTNGNSGTTATNSLSYSVAVAGSTATVTLSGGTLSAAAMQTLIDAMSYQNNSNDPNTSNRVVTITSLQDSGSNTGSNDNNAALSIASTVSMTSINDEPTLTATGSNPTFTEGGAAASLFSGSAASTVESGQTLTGFSFTVTNLNDGSSEIANVDGTAIALTNGNSGTTATNSLSYSVAVAGSTATVTLSGGTLSAAAMQTLIDAMSYQNNSNDPNTSNRVVTITSLQDSGSNTGSNDNNAALSIASTVSMTDINDEPTLTATGSNPTFTEGGAAASLFSGSAASTVESGQTLTGFSFTVTNLNDGSSEIANVDGTAIALTNGNSGTTATNSLSYSVAVAGSTATVTLSGGTLSAAAMQTLIDAMSYQNNSNDPNTSNRVVTITSLQDSGSNTGSNDNNAALSIASTVSMTDINDEPTLTATGSNPTFTEGGAAASLFSGSAASTVESGQTLTGFSFTVTNVNDGSSEIANVDGTAIALTNGNSGTTATNSLSYSVAVAGSTATVTLSGGTLSAAAMQTLIDAMSYQNNSNDPNTSNRVVTITSLQDSGSNTGSNDNNAALSIASTVSMTDINDEPTLTATGSNPTFTEGGAAASLFSGSAASTVESGQTLTGFSFTVTNLNDGSSEIANVDGTAIALTNGNSGTTATNSLSYSVAVAGSTATVTLSGGTLNNAAMQTLIEAMSYQNNSSDPNTSNRVVTITSLQDSGSNTGSNDNNAALSIASTVSINAVNANPGASGVPSDISVTEDTASNVDLSAITFTDVDSSPITVTLTISAGSFSTPADGSGVGSGVTATLVSATVITIAGAPADINTYLDTASNIQYTGASNVSGQDVATISVTANDGEGSGNVNLGTINIDITNVNDAPTATGIPGSITVNENSTSNLDLTGVTFIDVDGDDLTVTLSAASGILSAIASGGVTVGGSGTATISLWGTLANLNTYVNTVTNVTYTTPANTVGTNADTITVNANDSTVDPLISTINVNITANSNSSSSTDEYVIPTNTVNYDFIRQIVESIYIRPTSINNFNGLERSNLLSVLSQFEEFEFNGNLNKGYALDIIRSIFDSNKTTNEGPYSGPDGADGVKDKEVYDKSQLNEFELKFIEDLTQELSQNDFDLKIEYLSESKVTPEIQDDRSESFTQGDLDYRIHPKDALINEFDCFAI